MNKQQKIALIDDLIGRIGSLLPLDYNGISNLQKETEMIIKNIVEESSSDYIDSINNIRFSPSVYPASPSLESDVWHSGIERFLGLLGTIKREIE
ncbi:nucleotide-binding protein, partial [Bacillus sp. SRB_336]